ncbi:MAG: hypothetical protein K2X87_01770 [Gemmataceae bacterium]|nr:hypothetical protein [Gemmataceae bacterium]
MLPSPALARTHSAGGKASAITPAIERTGPGFFVYYNSALGVNRLVFTPDLANGEAPLTVLAALCNMNGQAAIDTVSLFSQEKFVLV